MEQMLKALTAHFGFALWSFLRVSYALAWPWSMSGSRAPRLLYGPSCGLAHDASRHRFRGVSAFQRPSPAHCEGALDDFCRTIDAARTPDGVSPKRRRNERLK